jgi:hypothetical protein
MATPKIIADFETQLSTSLAVGGTSFSLSSGTDDDGVALPNGLYYFTVDNGTSNKEYLAGTLSGTSVTGVLSVSRQGVETSGAARAHRVGASCILTDFATYKKYMDEIALVSAPDASTTTKGVVEIATLAQVRAGTGTGETGAILVVSPTELDDLPSQDQKNALAGDGATPSATNKYITQNRQMVAGETINGATLPVPVYQNKTDNEFYACDANDNTRYKYIGFATTDGTNGNPIRVQFSGVVSGFTGLQEGEKYYVQDTVGTIGTSIGTQEILVGIAISETELLIQKGVLRAAGNGGSLGTASGSLPVITGFRPSKISIFAKTINTAGTESSALDAFWVNGSLLGLSAAQDGGGTEVVENSVRLYRASGTTVYFTFSIGSVTDTGFTISWTLTGTWGGAAFFVWEAEGEL